ncbi:MAG: SDR family oxidoreductase [Cyanobacteria bacterium]|nr:SDR family oxidoreductase [Cyanobacteriota bacterium]
MKVVLVTGASSGLGAATAAWLAASGHRVYAASRRGSVDPLSDAVPLRMDVDDDQSVGDGTEHILLREGRIDVVVNCAGYGVFGSIEDTPLPMAQAQFNTNVFGVMRVCQRVLPVMRRERAGLIVNVTSIAGELSLPFQGIYSATKFAVEGLSEALRAEVRPFGIRVVLVQPGDFRTGFTDARRTVPSNGGAYAERSSRALEIAARDERAGADPQQLARLIARIVGSPRPRFRYVVGPAAQEWLMRLRHVLPGQSLIARHFGA